MPTNTRHTTTAPDCGLGCASLEQHHERLASRGLTVGGLIERLKRLPQDARIFVDVEGYPQVVRVNTDAEENGRHAVLFGVTYQEEESK